MLIKIKISESQLIEWEKKKLELVIALRKKRKELNEKEELENSLKKEEDFFDEREEKKLQLVREARKRRKIRDRLKEELVSAAKERFKNREIWKDIEGYEGLYQVSNMGRVKSFKWGKDKILKPIKYTWGYPKLNLCKEGKIKGFTVHRLVAKAFLENPLNLPQINHKDENKTNNRVENLEWCTASYNINYGSRNERHAKALSKQVAQYDKKGNLIKIFSSATQVKRELGFNRVNICKCCNNKYKSAYGYSWKYI